MSQNNTQESMPNFHIEVDENGIPVLPVEGQVLNKGKKQPQKVDNSEFANDDDIEAAIGGKQIQNNGAIEQASRPKLSKSGKTGIQEPTKTLEEKAIRIENSVEQVAPITPADIEETSIKHLITSADKSKQSISFKIEIDAIDKDLFTVLNKSYKDKSELILNLIMQSNKDEIQKSLKESIKKYYESQSEENN